MMNNKEKYELIERYLTGRSTAAETDMVNSLMRSDAAFAQEMQRQMVIRNIIIDYGIIGIKQQLNAIHRAHSHINTWKIWTAGMLIVAAFGVYFFLLQKPSPSSTDTETMAAKQDSVFANVPAETTPETDSLAITFMPMHPVTADGEQTGQLKDSTIEQKADEEQDVVPTDLTQRSKTTDNTIVPVPTEEERKEEQNMSATDLCEGVKIQAGYVVLTSCVHKATGSIVVEKFSLYGGKAPYTISIDGKRYQQDLEIGKLASGNYTLYIADANNCITTYDNIEVHEENCLRDYVFAPAFGEQWEIPAVTSGRIVIYNKYGKVVKSSQLYAGYKNTWDGRDDNGTELPMGNYKYLIEYPDGRIESGNVAIVK